MDENITLNVTLSRANAGALAQFLKRRVETLQGVENHDGSEALAESTQERDAIFAILMALEAAVNPQRHAGTRAMKPVLERLSQQISEVPFLESAEEEARRALAQATESLAQAHAAFASSLASESEIESSAAAAAIGVEQIKQQRAEAAYDNAAERTMERKAENAEVNRRVAYVQSQRAHDEALSALRQYEPLALEMVKLFSVLAMHSDLALAEVEAADKARISPHAANAVRHLKTALEEHKQSHTEAATKHVVEALHQLELAAE
jgi:hypothetical protein